MDYRLIIEHRVLRVLRAARRSPLVSRAEIWGQLGAKTRAF